MGQDSEHLTSSQAEALARWLRDGPDSDGDAARDHSHSIRGYVLGEAIGEGASSHVYLATREGSDRRLATKIFKQELGPLALAEAERLEQARLACLPEVADFGRSQDGAFFIATSYIDGRHATDWADAHELRTRERVELLVRICRAVGELHERGLIHRDLKPTNILVNDHGDVTLVDLGIGWSAAERERSPSGPDESGGTPTFAAPEQWDGDVPTTRMDVPALGATGFTLLKGVTLAKPLHAVLSKATSDRPEDRYPNARELAEDLERWLSRDPVEAMPAGILRRASRWAGRHALLATLVACVAMVVSTAAGTSVATWWLAFQPFSASFEAATGRVLVFARNGDVVHAYADVKGFEDGLMVRHEATRWFAMLPERSDGPTPAGLYRPGRFRPEIDFARLPIRQPEAPPAFEYHDDPERLAYGWDTYAFEFADVFDDDGTDEVLVAMRNGRHSATGVLVLDRKGQILASVWHDGQIDALAWHAQTQTLMAAGFNSEVGDHERLGSLHFEQIEYPIVAWGVRLEPGMHEWIRTITCEGTLEPVFYQCLTPISASQTIGVNQFVYGQDGAIRLVLEADDPEDGNVSFSVSPRGAFGPAEASGGYRPHLPDPHGLGWIALPGFKPGVVPPGRSTYP
ncbi:MAG: serine/threonine-protein kinase [Planctomycetota bacterium]